MPFVNEYVSSDDKAKYRLSEIDAKFFGGVSRQWTIDRERDIYLRLLSRGSEQDSLHRQTWSLYWKGELLTLRLDVVDGAGALGQPGWTHWRLISMGAPLSVARDELLVGLREALTAYKDGGVYAAASHYVVTLDDAQGNLL